MEVDDMICHDMLTAENKSCTFHVRSVSLCPMQGARVLILSGRFKGDEEVCLGEDRNARWAIRQMVARNSLAGSRQGLRSADRLVS